MDKKKQKYNLRSNQYTRIGHGPTPPPKKNEDTGGEGKAINKIIIGPQR